MKKIVKILILCLSCIGACWFLPACSSAIEEPESGGGVDGYPASLTFHIAVPGEGTRAGNIPEREEIDQLRIIVVDKETNKVDYNRLNNFPNRDGSTYTIGLDNGGKKYLYLLANTEDLDLDIPFKGEDWDNAVDDYVINPSLPEGRLPFTSIQQMAMEPQEVTLLKMLFLRFLKITHATLPLLLLNSRLRLLIILNRKLQSLTLKSQVLPTVLTYYHVMMNGISG